ncbi:protein kinase family protein [Campylobacter jejuni]|uniref:protein kinase family protein n=1 Tax=Campylobacter jejuni TaxID=197 RepID=UPI000C34BE1F|nr:protein kinase family protein [Campylobacter jejuni]EAH5976461.1 protein kinase family protein [Campylobacter jejuni]EAI4778445.1 protein kinase family protein [Campylobacter jejuni]EAL5009734.1 protein kinase family protein [Campylobacter jejuni]ECC3056369.1 protein kinase family protein [Campylobacter jejuni]EFQ2407169.1 protein kinase family protein [Campylobacter jejuni]
MDPIVNNHLINAYKDLESSLSQAYTDLYFCFENGKLKLVLSTLHNNIIECFKKMNSRLPSTENSNNHYWADDSRKLKFNIELALYLQKEFKDSELSFWIDEYYYNVFKQCLNFLKSSEGSEIPLGMQKITIYEAIPIFVKLNSISNPEVNKNYSLDLIGDGSYAKVYKYYDEFYKHYFALKKLNKKVNDKEIQRFIKEFNIMKQINNPYILKVYSLDENKKEYIMEYVDFTLKEYIHKNNSKLSSDERISLGIQIIKGIKTLWNKNILHRDISLKNILIKQYDDIVVIKISDFGLVKELNSELTSENTEIKGSLNEISRLQKKGFNNYDKSDEIYALSRVLYFIATGRTNLINTKCDFLEKGINDNIKNRYNNLDDLMRDFKHYIKKIYN